MNYLNHVIEIHKPSHHAVERKYACVVHGENGVSCMKSKVDDTRLK